MLLTLRNYMGFLSYAVDVFRYVALKVVSLANGEDEKFMKLLNKTEQRIRIENKPVRLAIQELLTGYRSTAHHSTGITPYDAIMDRKVRTKLDYVQPDLIAGKVKQSKVNKRDMENKMKIKSYAEEKEHKIS